jgi:hypothetical protein
LFAVGFYTSVLPMAPKRGQRAELVNEDDPAAEPAPEEGAPAASTGADAGAVDDGDLEGFIEGDAAEETDLADGGAGAFIEGEGVEHHDEHDEAGDASAKR